LIILADEPTGNLDTKNGEEIMKIFNKLHQEGHTIIVVTHEVEVAKYAQRIIHLRDGVIENDEVIENVF
jgi:putative ABC transport system ATP-binding protein